MGCWRWRPRCAACVCLCACVLVRLRVWGSDAHGSTTAARGMGPSTQTEKRNQQNRFCRARVSHSMRPSLKLSVILCGFCVPRASSPTAVAAGSARVQEPAAHSSCSRESEHSKPSHDPPTECCALTLCSHSFFLRAQVVATGVSTEVALGGGGQWWWWWWHSH